MKLLESRPSLSESVLNEENKSIEEQSVDAVEVITNINVLVMDDVEYRMIGYINKYIKSNTLTQAKYILLKATDYPTEFVQIIRLSNNIKYFEFKYKRFYYNSTTLTYTSICNEFQPQFYSKGQTTDRVDKTREIIGSNQLKLNKTTNYDLLLHEIIHPFYFFQIFSILIWLLDGYYYYAICILIISIASILTVFISTRKQLHKLSLFIQSNNNDTVVCCRNGVFVVIHSHELVVGDIYILPTHSVPCDSVLLSGDCIVNESMLTGESIPISKYPVNVTSDMFSTTVDSKHILFSGTIIIRSRPTLDTTGTISTNEPLAIVYKTGFNTLKGSLVRSMLYPKPNKFKFYSDAFHFILFMFILAVIGFSFSSIYFVRLHVPLYIVFLRACDLITIVVPPALAATMTIGTNVAINRLYQHGIYCISPPRVNVCGKVDLVCFDKTGTLTLDGLDIVGIVESNQSLLSTTSEHSISIDIYHFATPTYSNIDSSDLISDSTLTSPFVQLAMASCHSLNLVHSQIVGDPLDLKMFEFTLWTLHENSTILDLGMTRLVPTVVQCPLGQRYGIIRCFEFVSELRRMSVLVIGAWDSHIQLFCKGAPEVVKDICVAESLPSDYDERLRRLTHQGYRVLAIACKDVVLSYDGAMCVDRSDIERDLVFIGFIVFENKLKQETVGVMDVLRSAEIRMCMCTGDNVLTAIHVSKECGLVTGNETVFVPKIVDVPLFGGNHGPLERIRWESFDDPTLILDSQSLLPRRVLPSSYSLAITGQVFKYLLHHVSTETLHAILLKSFIFARMSPDEKQELVELFINIGFTTCFCGDGANDCGALKAADAGISLSEAEASVAAPFTSSITNISCIPLLLMEGRAALATSFSCFKYMAMYSLVQFTTVILLWSYAGNLGDMQYLFIDLFLILPLALFMSKSKTSTTLSIQKPNASLLSFSVLASLLGHILIQAVFQTLLLFLLKSQSWYTPPPSSNASGKLITTYENTTLFLASCFLYIVFAWVLASGRPFHEVIWRNYGLVGGSVVLVGMVLLMIGGGEWVERVFELVEVGREWKWSIGGSVVGVSGICWWWEGFVQRGWVWKRKGWERI